jgi:hypothetical protein
MERNCADGTWRWRGIDPKPCVDECHYCRHQWGLIGGVSGPIGSVQNPCCGPIERTVDGVVVGQYAWGLNCACIGACPGGIDCCEELHLPNLPTPRPGELDPEDWDLPPWIALGTSGMCIGYTHECESATMECRLAFQSAIGGDDCPCTEATSQDGGPKKIGIMEKERITCFDDYDETEDVLRCCPDPGVVC